MTTARKYDFQTEFSADGSVLSNGPRKYGQEELDAACAEAYGRGQQDAVAQAERHAAAAVQALAEAAAATLARLNDESRAMREEAALVAISAARKIAGAALKAFGEERCAGAIEATMDALRHQPRLLIKLNADTAEKLKPRLEEMREHHAYAGALLVRTEPSLRAGEVVIDWSDGVLALNPTEIETRIEALTQAALAAPQAAEEPHE